MRLRSLTALLSLSVACTSYHDALLSYAELDAGEVVEQVEGDAGPAADGSVFDGALATADAALVSKDAGAAPEDADLDSSDASVIDDATASDASSDASGDAGARSCCQMWDDLYNLRDGGLLDQIGPKPCVELLCKPPLLPLPNHP